MCQSLCRLLQRGSAGQQVLLQQALHHLAGRDVGRCYGRGAQYSRQVSRYCFSSCKANRNAGQSTNRHQI